MCAAAGRAGRYLPLLAGLKYSCFSSSRRSRTITSAGVVVVPSKRFCRATRTLMGGSCAVCVPLGSKKPAYLAPTTTPRPSRPAMVIPNSVLALMVLRLVGVVRGRRRVLFGDGRARWVLLGCFRCSGMPRSGRLQLHLPRWETGGFTLFGGFVRSCRRGHSFRMTVWAHRV